MSGGVVVKRWTGDSGRPPAPVAGGAGEGAARAGGWAAAGATEQEQEVSTFGTRTNVAAEGGVPPSRGEPLPVEAEFPSAAPM